MIYVVDVLMDSSHSAASETYFSFWYEQGEAQTHLYAFLIHSFLRTVNPKIISFGIFSKISKFYSYTEH